MPGDENTVQNKPHDEEIEVSDEDSVSDPPDSEGEQQDGRQGARGGNSANEEEFEFGDELSSRDDGSPGKAKARSVQNKPYDEAVSLSESESVDDGKGKRPPSGDTSSGDEGEVPSSKPNQMSSGGDVEGDDDDGSETSSEEEEEASGGDKTMGYNPADYANLQVSTEIKDLFQYIQRYKPHVVEIESKLKPFIPDFIPAIGEIDHFLKIPRADGKKDNLGLTVLDEPGNQQTDPTVLDLQLRAVSTQATLQPTVVPSIELANQHPNKITTWIQNISDLHKTNPPPNVVYTKNMPDVELLMQVWPQVIEEVLDETELPSAELAVDVKAYARIVCALLDIPVYTSLKESLHLLFTLYSELKASNADMMTGGAAALDMP